MPSVRVPAGPVLPSIPGVYVDGVWDWDFSSHYPRIISENNISPESVSFTVGPSMTGDTAPVSQLLVHDDDFVRFERWISIEDDYLLRVRTAMTWIVDNWECIFTSERSHSRYLTAYARMAGASNWSTPVQLATTAMRKASAMSKVGTVCVWEQTKNLDVPYIREVQFIFVTMCRYSHIEHARSESGKNEKAEGDKNNHCLV